MIIVIYLPIFIILSTIFSFIELCFFKKDCDFDLLTLILMTIICLVHRLSLCTDFYIDFVIITDSHTFMIFVIVSLLITATGSEY